MATYSEPRKAASPDAVQEVVRDYLDESVAFGRAWLGAWSSATRASLQAAFELQDVATKASRTLAESATQSSFAWFDQAAASLRQAQEVAGKLVAAEFDAVTSAMPNGRA